MKRPGIPFFFKLTRRLLNLKMKQNSYSEKENRETKMFKVFQNQ